MTDAELKKQYEALTAVRAEFFVRLDVLKAFEGDFAGAADQMLAWVSKQNAALGPFARDFLGEADALNGEVVEWLKRDQGAAA